MLTRDVMTTSPQAIGAETPIFDAMQTLFGAEFRHLPVVRDGELIGMLSDRDLRQFSRAYFGADPDRARQKLSAPVTSAMGGGVITVGPETELSEVVELLLEHRVGALPVVDEESGDLVGIVSYVDVLRAVQDLV